jgi:transcriptional regulator with XRE-family HTH domain
MKANLRLRREREIHAWSQARVAEEIGTDPATVSRWERGLSFPYPYFRERLCALFQKSPEDLGLVQSLDGASRSSSSSDFFYELPPLHSPLHDPTIPLPALLEGALVGRDPLLFELRQILSASQFLSIVSLYGLPGIGKTSLAVHLAHDPLIKEHFYDGVLWASLGPSPNLLSHLTRWGSFLGVSPSQLPDNPSIDSWVEALHLAIGQRKFLLVIDDVWNLPDALVFKIGGHNCAYLFTTRFPLVALCISTNNAFALEELTDIDGIALLERFAPGISSYEPQAILDLVRAVGGLPLALTLMGKYLRIQAHNQQPRRIHAAVRRLLNANERLHLSEPYAPGDRHSSFIQESPLSLLSVISISDQLLSFEARQTLRALSLFPPKPNDFSEDAALLVSSQSYEILDSLSDSGLLQSRGPGRYTLHQTICDYARLHSPESEIIHNFVSYFVQYAETYENDYASLERECNNIIAALQLAYEHHFQSELEQGVISFSVFLEASRHPRAPLVRSWLTAPD